MGKNIFVIILILSIFTISCEKLPNAPENDSAIIVQAYLYANEPISDIRITTLGEDKGFNSHTLPVIDANVSLIKKGMNYQLTPSATDSGYYFILEVI